MKIITFLLKYSRKRVFFSVLAGICSGACNVALLAVINEAMKKNGATPALVWSFVGLCALLPVARFASEFLLTKLGQSAMYTLRIELCRQILAAPLRHLEQLGAPRLLAVLTEDIPTITAATLNIPLLCVLASLVAGCLVYMGILSPLLLVVVLGFMVIGIVTYQLPINKVQTLFELTRKDANVLQGHFQALTQGAKELKIHSRRRQAFVEEQLKVTANSMRRHNILAQNLYSAAANWGQTMVFIVVGFVLFVLPLIRHLNSTMTLGYTLTLLYLTTPLQMILNAFPQWSRATVALANVEALGFALSAQAEEEITSTHCAPRKWHKLELRSVTHTYRREGEPDSFVLGPLDLSFQSGELVFIIGGNGSGKTTFIKLLAGLYMPEKGHIFIDGDPIGDANKEFYRQHFSTVFSDFYLFEQMLGLMNPELDSHAKNYLAQFKLAHKVAIVNGTFSTTELSQGQRKRLALLTAYLEDRSIYIFDEWAADQDPHFKAVFYMQLLPELKARHKTVFVISHDDRYYHVADRIIKMDEGQVVSDILNAVDPAAGETVG